MQLLIIFLLISYLLAQASAELELLLFPTYAFPRDISVDGQSIEWEWTVQSVLVNHSQILSPIFNPSKAKSQAFKKWFGPNYQRQRLQYFPLSPVPNVGMLFLFPDCLKPPVDYTAVKDEQIGADENNYYDYDDDAAADAAAEELQNEPETPPRCWVQKQTSATARENPLEWKVSVRLDSRKYAPGSRYIFQATAGGQPWQTVVTLMADGRGLSFVFDMDETLKPFGTNFKVIPQSLIGQPYRPYPDIPSLIRKWYTEAQPFSSDASSFVQPTIHLVSGAIWQLIPSFLEFFKSNSIPLDDISVNPMDISSFRGVIESFMRFARMGRYKLKHLRRLIQQYPQRRFILMGDTAICDHWVYAKLLKEFPVNRIPLVLLHRVPTASWRIFSKWKRPESYFKDIPNDRWLFYKDVSTLMEINMRYYLLQQ